MKLINDLNSPAAIGPYSHAVKSGNLLFTSGQIPIDPATSLLVEDEITVQKTEELIDSGLVKNILLTSSNLPARLISQEGAIEIVPPDFKTINANKE